MLKSLLSILVCPFDKVSSLELIELVTKNNISLTHYDEEDYQSSSLENKLSNTIHYNNVNDALKEVNDIVIEGILFCNTCMRFYPIMDEIPIILPDDLRDKSRDLEFLKKHIKSLPKKIIQNSLPWHL